MSDVDAIRARHKSARPNPSANPSWFHAEHDIARLLEIIDSMQRELDGYRAFKHGIDEALNSGDGVYRP